VFHLRHALQLADLAEQLHADESSRAYVMRLLCAGAHLALNHLGIEFDESIAPSPCARVILQHEFDMERAWRSRIDPPTMSRSLREQEELIEKLAATVAEKDPSVLLSCVEPSAKRIRTATGSRIVPPSGAGRDTNKIDLLSDLRELMQAMPELDELDAIMGHIKTVIKKDRRQLFWKEVRSTLLQQTKKKRQQQESLHRAVHLICVPLTG
jgi:hypothetical protein